MPLFKQASALFALILLFLVGMEAQAAGFAMVAPSITGRAYSTSTLLPSGRVLVVGGEDVNGALLPSVEVYDPSINKWSSAAPLITAREHHTATLLPSGKVLVVGGIGANATILASGEIYDPVANSWSLAGTLLSGRAYHTMTQLPSGKVLVAGGQTGVSAATKTAELYDPSTNAWSAAANLTYSRASHVAALLPSGKVLAIGGYTDVYPMGGSPYVTSVEVYDPESNTWTDRAPLLTGRRFATATVLASGRVLVAGGYSATGFEARVETYDVANNVWSSTTSLGSARMSFTATLLPSGKLMVIGGTAAAGPVGTSELYDPATTTWTGVQNLLPARYAHTATLLPSGKVLVATGAVVGGVAVGAERYDGGGDSWASTSAMSAARSTHTATRLVSGKVLITGGSTTVPLASAELYDPATSSFTFVPSLSAARTGQTATLLLSGKVLVVGGMTTNSTYLASAELFDPTGNSWQSVAPLNTPRALHTSTLLPSGKVLVAAGTNSGGRLKSAEIYDPVANTWTTVGSLQNARMLHSATLLRNGKVLVAGGSDAGALSNADLFDPASGTWQPIAALATARHSHTATLLHSGKVLIAGGASNGALATTFELYDPTTSTWSTSGPLLTPRSSHAATLLASGEVLIAGGNDASSIPTISAERYDPMVNAASSAGNLGTARAYHGATLLPSGKVLIEGGVGTGNGTLLSAEIYDPGLAFVDGRRPVIAATNTPTTQGTPLILTGTKLNGDTEGAGGNSNQASPTDYPLVQMRRLDNDQVLWTQPDASSTSWDGSYQTQPLNGLPLGQYVVTAFANAIPSLPKMLLLTGPAASIAVSHGSPQSAPVNSLFLPMLARVVDSANDPVWGAMVTFASPASGASASCSPASIATDANGLAQTTCTANGTLGSYSVAASAAGVGVPASFALTNITGPAAAITVSSGSPQSTTVNTAFAQALKARVADSGNNPLAGVAVTFAVLGNGASATCQPASPVLTDVSGVASVTCSANTTAGAYTVDASANALPAAHFSLTNVSGAAAAIAINSGGGQSTTINTVFPEPLAVSVVDSFNNGVANSQVTFVVPPNGASAICPAATTDANGHAQVACSANGSAGNYAVKAGSGALTSATVSLTNVAGAPTSINYATQPSNAAAGANIAPPIVVHVQDVNGNPIAADGIKLTLSANPGGSTLTGGGTVTTNALGDATFVGVSLDRAGTGYALKATDSSQSPLTVISGSFNINAGAATTIGFSAPPTNAVAGSNIAPPIVVHVQDANGNPVAADGVKLTLASNPGGSTLTGGGTVTTNATGDAMFASVSLDHSGSGYTLKATDSSATPLATTSGAFNISAGTAATISMQSGSPQSTMVGTMFGTDLQAKVVDALNNPVSGAGVLFTGPSSGSSATCSPIGAITGANGIATSTCTANAIAGSYVLSAGTSGVPTPAAFNLTNLAGMPSSITMQAGSQQSAVVNTPFAQPLTAKVLDNANNPVSGVPVTFTTPGAGPGATCVPSNPVPTNANGLATITCTANTIAGAYSVDATTGALPPAHFSLTNLPGAAAMVAITSGGSQSTLVNTSFAQPLLVSVVDSFNNGVGNVPVGFVVPPSGASAACPGTTTDATGHAQTICAANSISGSYAVKGSSGALSSSFVSLTNLAGASATITVIAGSPQSTTVNTAFTQALKAKVVDGANNPVTGASVTFAVPGNGAGATCLPASPVATDAGGVAAVTCTANTIAGGYAVNASTGALPAVQFGLTNVPAAANAVSVVSGGGQSAPVTVAFAQPLVISVVDAFNNGVGNTAVTVIVPQAGASAICPNATTDATGHAESVCSANAIAGSYSVNAASGALTSSAASLTNLAGAPAAITMAGGSPQSTVVNTPFAQALKARVVDGGSNPVAGVAVTFTVPGSGPSVTCLPASSVLTDSNGLAAVTCTANTMTGALVVNASTAGLPSAQFDLVNLPGAAAMVSIVSGGGQSTLVNTAFPQPLVVSVVDTFNNGVGNAPIAFVVPPGGPSAGCPGVTTDSSGHAQAICTANSASGSYSVQGSFNGLSSSPVYLTNLVGAVASISYTTQPSDTVAGVDIAPPIAVHASDGNGNPVAGEGIELTLAANPGGSVMTGGGNVTTDAGGDAVFANVSLDRAGTGYTVTASAGPLVATSQAFDISAGAAAMVAVGAGSPQYTIVDTVFAANLQARVVDALDNPIAGVSVLFAAPPSGPGATCAPTSTTTDSNGIAQTTCTANGIPGTYIVYASYGSLTPASFNLTNIGPLAVVCELPTQIGLVGDSVNLDLATLFSAPYQTLTYDAIGLPPSLSVNTSNGWVTGVLDQNDVADSPYAVTLRATGETGSVDENVSFVVLDRGDVVFRDGFEDPSSPQPCQ